MIDRDPALAKFRAYRDYISIRTISRKHKSPQSFTLPRPSFTDLEADGYLLLDDGYSFALFRLIEDGAMVQIDFTWLVKYSDNTLKGYAETVVLGYDRLAQWIWDSSEENGPETWSMFSPGYTSQRPRLDFSSPGAQETIRHVLAVPVLRHKLTRAFRDFFQWPRTGDHVISFYADWDRYSFTFRETINGQDGICGGLVLHHHDGLEKAYYEVHT